MLRDYLELLLLLAVVCVAMAISSGNTAEASPSDEHLNSVQSNRNTSASRACALGEIPFWIDPATMECLKEQR